jgi:hypothetical protein
MPSVTFTFFIAVLSVIILNIVMLNVIMLSVVLLSVVMLNVVAPFSVLFYSDCTFYFFKDNFFQILEYLVSKLVVVG